MEYKSIEKPIVRESKVRNVFSKVCKKELFYTNLKVNSASEELLKSSKSLFAYPSSIGGGSCLSITKLSNHGKVPDTPFCIKGHTDPISCFEFSNFNDYVIATGGRDCTIKIWEVPEEGLVKDNLVTPLITLPKQQKRVTGVYFHPSVDSLFMSSTLDYTLDIWDLSSTGGEQSSVIQKLTGHEDLIMSVGWNTWSGGDKLATSSRDKKMRLYDPRSQSSPIQTISTHEGAQGFKLCWADSNGLELICTVGANKSAQRQLYLWDPRQLQSSQPLVSKDVTTDSSILSPYYDFGTNMVYLGGKGDGIYYYEIEKNSAHQIGKATFGNVTQSAITLLPKGVVDVNICEIDRFLRLTASNSVEMVSFMCPRKSQLFQEDIFPPCPSGDPTTDCSLWFNDKQLKVIPHTISMKPDGVQSIYEVSEEEGGKSKEKDKLEQLSKLSIGDGNSDGNGGDSSFITEGMVKQEIEGWLFNSYENRYLKIIKDRIYCFLNEDSAQAIWDSPILNVKYVDIYDEDENTSGEEWSLRFNIILLNGKEHKMECSTVQQRDSWCQSINAYREMKQQVDQSVISPTMGEFHLVNTTPVTPSPMVISENNNNKNALQKFSIPSPKEQQPQQQQPQQQPQQQQSESPQSTTPKSSTPTLSRHHSVLSRNPSYTSLKSSGGFSKPSPSTSTPPSTFASPLTIAQTTTTTTTTTTSTSSTPPPLRANSTLTTPLNSSTGIKQSDIIIEGNLTELIPGLLWNSNTEKWYVVSEGMLYSYRNKSLKQLDPLETIHLEKAISAHKTKDIFTIQGFSFQLSTPNRIIHLLAKTKEERGSWLSVLRQNLKSSGESKPKSLLTRASTMDELISSPMSDDETNTNEGGIEEEEEEEQPLEGQLSRKLPGIFSMWGQCFVALLAEDLFVSRNKLSTTPELRIQLSSISLIKKISPNEFTLYDSANQVVCNFRTIPPTPEFDDCTRWIDGLEAARKRSIDIIKMFGINEKEVLSPPTSSSSSIPSSGSNGNLLDPTADDLTRFLDLTAIKNGKQKILIQVKGKRKIRVRMVKLSTSSLNCHNSFILDAGPRIFVWAGSKTSRVNKAKALDFANRIRTKERGGKSTLIQLDQGRDEQSFDFWEILGGNNFDPVATTPTPEEQDSESIKTSIYRVGLDVKKNSLRARLAWEGTDWKLPNKEILNTKFVFVVDCVTEIFVWVGKESSSIQRKMAIKVALVLQAQKDRLDWTKITRLTEFGENNLFKEKFANYPGMLPISTTRQEIKSHVAISKVEHKIETLASRMSTTFVDNETLFTIPIDEGGRVKVWKIEDYEKIDHPQNLYSQFFSSDSYIVLYTYMQNNKEAHVIYYYLGRDSSINEKGTSAYLTVDLHESLVGACVQTRVVANKECKNFLNLFKGKMVIHKGKFNNYDPKKPSLYQVKGLDKVDTRAVQVEFSTSMLNTLHVSILRTPEKIYIWHGKFSLDSEQSSALSIAENFNSTSTPIETLKEGDESNEFWSHFESSGGKHKYFNDIMIQSSSIPTSFTYKPRFFVCSNASGIVEVTEESPFSQDDLDIGSVCILDVQSHIYLWIGNRATHRTKRTSMEVVLNFIETSKLGHSKEHTQVLIVNPFEEPIGFKSYFRAWCTSKYPKNKLPLVEKVGIPVEQVLKDYLKEIYTYEELLADPLPAGVDSTKLDTYLSDEDFEKVFKMTRTEWLKIPAWKREGIKKELFLF
ncbi:hypothetical protein ACTA71_001285 [Dictyostelium dimigraforme]